MGSGGRLTNLENYNGETPFYFLVLVKHEDQIRHSGRVSGISKNNLQVKLGTYVHLSNPVTDRVSLMSYFQW